MGACRASEGRLENRPSAEPPVEPLPPGVHELDLGPGVEALLSVPAGAPVARPLLVFFHGAGGTAGAALLTAGRRLLRQGVLVLATSSVARSWDVVAGGLGRDVAVLDAALAAVSGAAAVTRTAVAGFSDGASYALTVGLANGGLFEAVLAFSPGFLAPPRLDGRPRVWISHGTRDPVLPVDRCGRRVAAELAAAGYDVTYEEFDGPHVVPPELVTEAVGWWLG